jgi:hypothetical protein
MSQPTDDVIDPRVVRVLWQALGLAIAGLALAPTLGGPGAMPGATALWLVALPGIALAVAYRHRLWPKPRSEAPVATAHRRRNGERRGGNAARSAPVRRGRRLRAA